MMKIIALGSAAAVAVSLDSKQAFLDFMKQHGKEYEAEELSQRYVIFKANLAKIEEHNSKNESWTMGITQFADLTEAEFSSGFKGYNHRNNDYIRSQNLHQVSGKKLADSIDWVAKGAVTPVKDQGQCGSCWAFSTTGSTEGAWQLAKGELVSLAEQELVDCAGAEGNLGCNGGLMDDGFQYIMKNKGLGAESSYKYMAKDGTCKKVDSIVTISGFKDVEAKSESALKDAVNQQPVSIAVDALTWQLYHSGVMSNCKGQQLDHGVLLVGYGSDAGKDYWTVKNSWGASWGESGYIRLLQGMDSCGLANAASYPTV